MKKLDGNELGPVEEMIVRVTIGRNDGRVEENESVGERRFRKREQKMPIARGQILGIKKKLIDD